MYYGRHTYMKSFTKRPGRVFISSFSRTVTLRHVKCVPDETTGIGCTVDLRQMFTYDVIQTTGGLNRVCTTVACHWVTVIFVFPSSRPFPSMNKKLFILGKGRSEGNTKITIKQSQATVVLTYKALPEARLQSVLLKLFKFRRDALHFKFTYSKWSVINVTVNNSLL